MKFSCRKFSAFECIDIQFKCSNNKNVLYLVYRPAGHNINYFSFADFESLLIESQMCCGIKKVYLDGFNAWIDQEIALKQINFVVYMIILV